MVKERGYTLDGAKQALEEKKNLKTEVALINRLEWIKKEMTLLKSALDESEL